MHHAMAEDPHVSLLVRIDRLTAAHALREHRVDRAGELLHRGIGWAAANVHGDHNRERQKFLGRIEHVRIPIIAGIWPLVSLRNAEFLANEVPGVTVPAPTIERMRVASAESKERGVAEGIAIAKEMLGRVRP